MTSSMLSGERRWASARRGGMTVLGKVAVPKPINLPSQRLENHGMDPNVEIVPKGTHGWGSKSSSSSSNAWGSPNTDGGTGSPSYLSGRPSSGGTGTRPSTAGSDKAHDQVTNAWGSSSRPSSSSGVLTSNQASQTALRPHSAETRPGSSQLSRFAEPLSDNTGAWGGTGRTSEKLGVTSSKNDGFSLSTGDFPSLGSEKDDSRKNGDSRDHGSRSRPGSSSGAASVKEHAGNSAGDFSSNALGAGSWRKESSMYGEDGTRSNVEKWHADPQPYHNSNIHHSQLFDSWHGPPVNHHPGGVWYRGPPGGPPFGSPVPPGGFPMEPFPYFHPHMPPPPLANPQPVHPPNTAPRSSHPQNGDMYRPQMRDPYVRPGMPLRPGFYPGPVPYDNYYGPPIGYCNSNERDVPFMGMAMGPAGYNRYPVRNVPDPGNSLGRTSGHGPTSNPMVSEQVEAVPPQDARGPYKVLLKQHDSWEGRDQVQRWDDNDKTNSLQPSRESSWENGWRTDDGMDDDMGTRKMILDEGTVCEAVDNRAVPLKVKLPENVKSDSEKIPKDSSLIQKIEGLNAKSRACDVRQDVKSVSTREEQKSTLQVGNMMTCHPTNQSDSAAFSHEKAYGSGIINSASHEDRFSDGGKSFESTIAGGTTTARKSTHGKADHHGKMRFNNKEVDGWHKKTNVHSEVSYASHGPEISCAATQNVHDGDSNLHITDANESQRAKMKELAKRIKQREKEEDERTRDQRAKALAKLEELNRRTQAGESVTEKLETVPRSVIQSRQELSTPVPLSLSSNTNAVVHAKEKLETVASNAVHSKLEESSIGAPPVIAGKSGSGSAVSSSRDMIAQSDKSSVNKDEKSASTMSNLSLETPKDAHNECAKVQEQLKPSGVDGNYVDAASSNIMPIHDVGTGKPKRSSYRQKQNSSMDKNFSDKPTPLSITEASKGHSDIASNAMISFGSIGNETVSNIEANLSVNPSVKFESSAHHRKKSRSGKNKHKAEEASSAAALPSKELTDTVESSGESARPKTSEAISVQSMPSLTDSSQSLDLHSSLNNQWKSQHPRRTMKNQQGAKSSDKIHGTDAVVWAPVRSQNKVEGSDEAMPSFSVEASVKGNHLVQNNPRSKRAEMERYTPKPAAKELSHQSGSHQAIVPSNKITSNEAVERQESGTVGIESSQTSDATASKIGATMESRNGDVRQNKPGKVHGSWRQRAMAESTTGPNPSRNFRSSFEDQQHSDEWNDGWNMPESPEPTVNVSVSRDQGVGSRGKRYQHKGHKGTGHIHNPEENPSKISMQSAATDSPVGERSTSHWQPKTQPLPATDQRGSQPRANKKESTRQGGSPLLPRPDKDTSSARSHQSLSEKTNFEEAPDVERHQGPKRERITVGRRGRPVSPIEDVQLSGGPRRYGNANNHYSREHESPGEWSGQKSNPHYEYQPVGPQNNKNPKEYPHNSGARCRERGQGQSRRGRQSGSVQVDGGYE